MFCLLGVSTRRVERLVEQLGVKSLSRSRDVASAEDGAGWLAFLGGHSGVPGLGSTSSQVWAFSRRDGVG